MTPAPISVERLPEKWRRPPTKAGVEWIEANARRQCAYELEQALPALLQQLAEREAEVERLNAECNDRIRQALENGQAFHAAERAWEEACGLLREVASDYGARHFLGDDLDDRIAAFLAASGGA